MPTHPCKEYFYPLKISGASEWHQVSIGDKLSEIAADTVSEARQPYPPFRDCKMENPAIGNTRITVFFVESEGNKNKRDRQMALMAISKNLLPHTTTSSSSILEMDVLLNGEEQPLSIGGGFKPVQPMPHCCLRSIALSHSGLSS